MSETCAKKLNYHNNISWGYSWRKYLSQLANSCKIAHYNTCVSYNNNNNNNNDNNNTNNNMGRGSGLSSLRVPSWVDTTITASACLNWLALAYYGWKGNGNPTRSIQSTSCEILKTYSGCLPELVSGDTGQ